MSVFEAGVNFTLKRWDAFIAVQLLESSVCPHRSWNRGQNAVISPRPLHPHPIHYQTNPKEPQTAASNTSLPRSLTVTARTTDVCDLDLGGGGLQTHWLWHFESTRDIRDGNMCFVLSVSVPNNAVNKAEQRSSQSPRSKIRLWLWNHGRFRTPRRECAASRRERTLHSKVQSSCRVPFVSIWGTRNAGKR